MATVIAITAVREGHSVSDDGLGHKAVSAIFWMASQFGEVTAMASKGEGNRAVFVCKYAHPEPAAHAHCLDHADLLPGNEKRRRALRWALSVADAATEALATGRPFGTLKLNRCIRRDMHGTLQQAIYATGLPFKYLWGRAVCPGELVGATMLPELECQMFAGPPLSDQPSEPRGPRLQGGCVAHIGCLLSSTTAADLAAILEQLGEIVVISMRLNELNSTALVQFARKEAFEWAMQEHRMQSVVRQALGCHFIRVERSKHVRVTNWPIEEPADGITEWAPPAGGDRSPTPEAADGGSSPHRRRTFLGCGTAPRTQPGDYQPQPAGQRPPQPRQQPALAPARWARRRGQGAAAPRPAQAAAPQPPAPAECLDWADMLDDD